MNALEKQIKMVLEKRPIDFKALTNEMTDVTFDVVMQQWKVCQKVQTSSTVNFCMLINASG